ncbi:MAG TPA: AbrB family transcriptional regulator [Deltaproteobacteria bacterium]|nr:AbrB family transcriptional regulator [Deltaproteobacteria bacterium]
MAITARITSKGQVTIPKKIRHILQGDVVEFEVLEGKVMLKPVASVGGSLSKYAVGLQPIAEVRKKVWGEVAHDKAKS